MSSLDQITQAPNRKPNRRPNRRPNHRIDCQSVTGSGDLADATASGCGARSLFWGRRFREAVGGVNAKTQRRKDAKTQRRKGAKVQRCKEREESERGGRLKTWKIRKDFS
jgi:hypothetical protein